MSRIKAIIYTSSDNTNDLVFENEDILAISTNTKCIENENLPEFDIFPNSGTLTVKDRNLNIYNKAINGFFDNYEYKVKYFLENEIIATHIINQRPKYDYDAKTCTFYLGNSLDSLANQTFTPYAYPLKSETLDVIFEKVLGTIFNINKDYYDELMNNIWGNSSVTFAKYFQQINITYPYISETTSREALKTILLIAQCGMYLDKNNKLKLIRLDGYSNATADEYYNNVYKIEPRHMNKGFVPSVILDNKFNQININAYKDEIKTLYGEQVYDMSKIASTLYPDTPTPTYSDEIDWTAQVHIGQGHLMTVAVSAQRIRSISYFDESFSIKKYQNNNLNNILEIFESKQEGEENPSISILASKTTKTYSNCHIDVETSKIVEYSTGTLIDTKEEEINLFPRSFSNTDSFSFTYDDYGTSWKAESNTTLNIETDYKIYKQVYTENPSNAGFDFEIKHILGGIKYDILHAGAGRIQADQNYLVVENGEIQEVEIKAKAITIRVRGNVETITFESLLQEQKKTNENNYYKTNLQNTKELAHSSSYLQNENNKILDYLGDNLLDTFKSGLHTGTLTVANTNYNFVNPKYENITQNILFLGKEKSYNGMFVSSIDFNQSFNIMADEINGIELSDSFKKIEVEYAPNVWINGVNTTIGYEIQAKKDTTKNQIIVKIYFYPRQNINNFSFSNFSLTGTIKKLINTNKKLFEIGDKVMPYKDKPIINRVVEGVEEPVVFQIVDCETFNESGATFQNLVLREIKKPTT